MVTIAKWLVLIKYYDLPPIYSITFQFSQLFVSGAWTDCRWCLPETRAL